MSYLTDEQKSLVLDYFMVRPENKIYGHYYRNSRHGEFVRVHESGDSEYRAFGKFRELFPDLEEYAYKSLGMGIGQVMGFNHLTVGYESAKQMFFAFQDSADAQVQAVRDFITKSNPKLAQAVKKKDWEAIARMYNGPGQVEFYSKKLKGEYERLKNANG